MKWDEIHDQSRVVVDKAIENLLAEGKEVKNRTVYIRKGN